MPLTAVAILHKFQQKGAPPNHSYYMYLRGGFLQANTLMGPTEIIVSSAVGKVTFIYEVGRPYGVEKVSSPSSVSFAIRF